MAKDNTYRLLIRCAGCRTLWKVPPTTIEPTLTSATIGELRENPDAPLCSGTSDKRCPMCGSEAIDVMRSQVPAEEAARIMGYIA